MTEVTNLEEIDGFEDNASSLLPSIQNGINKQDAINAIKTLLTWIGENPNREGLIDTPSRVIKSYTDFFKGYSINPSEILNRTFNEINAYTNMVLLKNIRLESYCEHHMVPFIGKAHVAYIPMNKVVGISKLARVVEAYSKRLQIQESLTMQIANCINDTLNPKGVAVYIEAEHQCMSTRGVRKPGISMVTTSYLGAFEQSPELRKEFKDNIKS